MPFCHIQTVSFTVCLSSRTSRGFTSFPSWNWLLITSFNFFNLFIFFHLGITDEFLFDYSKILMKSSPLTAPHPTSTRIKMSQTFSLEFQKCDLPLCWMKFSTNSGRNSRQVAFYGAWSHTNLMTGDQMFWLPKSASVFRNLPLAVEVLIPQPKLRYSNAYVQNVFVSLCSINITS